MVRQVLSAQPEFVAMMRAPVRPAAVSVYDCVMPGSDSCVVSSAEPTSASLVRKVCSAWRIVREPRRPGTKMDAGTTGND